MRLITIMTLLSLLCACHNSSKQLENSKSLYQTALDNDDVVTARVALTHILQIEPDNVTYKDSLARLYINQGNYKGGTKLGQEVLDLGKADVRLQELLGLAYQQIPDIESSDAIFDGLFQSTGDYKHYYQKVAMAMNNQPIFDSLANKVLEAIKEDSAVAKTVILFPTNTVKQEVPLEAATYYLIARQAIEMQQDFRKSEKYYIKAIELFDPFYMARKDISDVYALAEQQRQAQLQARRR